MGTATAVMRSPLPRAVTQEGDVDLVTAARNGDSAAFEAIMRRHNRTMFRTARAILQNEADAEEVVQEAYLKAFLHLDGFAGAARLSTWLVKITVNEALGRLRRRMPGGAPGDLLAEDLAEDSIMGQTTAETSPEAAAAQGEIRRLLEAAIDALPHAQRTVFMLRAVEEFSTEDTAACLGIPQETVKTRLHRARLALRRRLQHRVAAALTDTFPFAGARCDRVVATVLMQLELGGPDPAPPG
jgi:RNA polymerase sigma-70 factor (ECF subfamily)